MSNKKILEKMLVDESSILPKIVELSGKIFKVDKSTGDPVFLIPQSKLSHSDLMAIGLLSKYMANQLEIVDTASVTPTELGKRFKLKKMIAGARLNDLKSHGIAKLIKWGEYRVSLPEALRYLEEELAPKLEKHQKQKE